jgi:hypothetical protein
MIRTLSLVIALAAAACGGKKSEPTTTSTTSGGTAGAESGGSHEEHAGMPAELTRFHDILRPLWHAEKGPKRMTDTCAAVPQMKTEADAIAKVTPPVPANADTWTSGTRALVASVADLDVTCKANDSAKFEAAFSKVHDAFHALMMAAGMKHEGMKHEGMKHEGMKHEGGEHKH